MVDQVELNKGGGKTPNPPEQGKPNPDDPNNPTPGSDDQNSKKITELTEKNDTLSRQYKSSTEEALRLKEEKEALAEENKKLKETSPAPSNDDAFNNLVSEKGMVGAIKDVVQEAINPLAKQTHTLTQSNATKIYDGFKLKHPGLKDDILVEFDKEFKRLKDKMVYDTVEEALNAAYKLVDGVSADTKAKEEVPSPPATNQEKIKSENETAALIQQASGGSKDNVSVPVSTKDSVNQKQLKSLEARAVEMEHNGRDATDLWIQHEQLKQQVEASKAKAV